MAPNEDWEKYSKKVDDKPEEKIVALDDQDIQILKTYGQGPYSLALKKIDQELKDIQKRIDEKLGVKESDTGLAPPNLWDLQADKQRMGEHTLNVARCSTIIKAGETKTGAVPQPAATNPQDGGGGGNPEGDKYVINIRQHAKYVVGLDENVAPTDVEGESPSPSLAQSNPCFHHQRACVSASIVQIIKSRCHSRPRSTRP
jgi:26S proteasome regulatory subunit T1